MGLTSRGKGFHLWILGGAKMLALSLLLAQVETAFAQFSISDSLRSGQPEFRYQFPINPGQPGLLAGTMGELRSTHFHAGIDIRTNNMVGAPVIAAQQGYVSRVMISSYGYGTALFIKHPNGQTTLYGHLERYHGILADFVKQVQYRLKTFDVDLFFEPNQFRVPVGDTVAFSGNTGGSSGPHLHFEIRDSANEALNPLLFSFGEIKDAYAPIAQKIAFKTLDINSRINDRFGRFEFYLYRAGDTYILPKQITAHGKIGIEILAYDKMDRSGFKCGINYIDMFADSQKVFQQVIDKINFNETRGILALMDYKALKETGSRFNKLYVDDGTRVDYHETIHNGAITIDQRTTSIRIVLRDSYGNNSVVKFEMKNAPLTENPQYLSPMAKPIEYDLEENTLSVSVRPCTGNATNSISVFSRNDKTEMTPTYQNSARSVYLMDLRKTMIDSVVTCSGTLHLDFKDAIPSGTDYKYYSDIADIKFRDGALYDTLYLTLSRSRKDSLELFSIGNNLIPLHKPVDVTLKPERRYSIDGKTGVYQMGINKSYTYLGGEWKNETVHIQIQEMGDFSIMRDTTPPILYRIYLNSKTARFRTYDKLSGIGHFEASIDGKWLLMNYDYKTGILQSDRLDKTKPLHGEFQLRVKDNAGNEVVFKQKIL